MKSAELKATKKFSWADASIAAGALLESAVLVHKDLEFITVDCAQLILPYK